MCASTSPSPPAVAAWENTCLGRSQRMGRTRIPTHFTWNRPPLILLLTTIPKGSTIEASAQSLFETASSATYSTVLISTSVACLHVEPQRSSRFDAACRLRSPSSNLQCHTNRVSTDPNLASKKLPNLSQLRVPRPERLRVHQLAAV